MNASEKIDQYIEKAGDWRGEVISEIRKLIHEVEPGITEEWKWNSPVWSYKGMVCSPGAFKNRVGVNFFQGAHLKDEHGLFNSSLEAKNARSVNFNSQADFDASTFRNLLQSAIAHNNAKG